MLHEDLTPNKKWEGTQPKMFLPLTSCSMCSQEWGQMSDRQCIVAHKILSLASLCCRVARQAHRPPQAQGDGIYFGGARVACWAIYDGVLLPGDLPELQGQHNWVQIIAGTDRLMYRGDRDSAHCSHAPPYHLILCRLPGGPCSNMGTLHCQELHPHLDHPGPPP